MAESRYQQIYEGEWQRPPRKAYRQACCFCGLIHVYDFRLNEGAIEFRLKVDKRGTGQYRRQQKAREEKEGTE